MTERDFATVEQILACHAQFGELDWRKVKQAMGPNWPEHWEKLLKDFDG